MTKTKKHVGQLQDIKERLQKECNFIKSLFSVLSVPTRMTDDAHNRDDEYVYVNPKHSVKSENKEMPANRAQNIVDLQRRLEKVKQENNFSLKNKLMKKSLTTKLSKKARKAERKLRAKQRNRTPKTFEGKMESEVKKESNVAPQAKPVFNSDGKLVFSKFDFTNMGNKSEKKVKTPKDPKKLLEHLKKKEETVKQLQESGNTEKAAEIKQKIAWKNALAKAEGEKVKDDPILLKKSLKKMETKKKQSKKKWEERAKTVEQNMQERQKKRQENITKKKKEKKSKIMKKAVKKGRIVM